MKRNLFVNNNRLVVAFLVTYPILQFRIKTNKTQTINEIGQIYSLATNISFILMSFTPILDLNNNTILALLFGVYLTRSIIVLLKINYESIEI